MQRDNLLIIGAILLLSCFWQVTPPFSFPSQSTTLVSEGLGLYELGEKLERENIIRSSFWFRAAAILFGGEHKMKAGQYYFEKPQNSLVIAWRIIRGDHKIETVKITIPEGFTLSKISKLFDQRFKFFDHEGFLKMSEEGYLFPDTYFVPVTATATSTIKLMHDNFDRQISSLLLEIKDSGRSLEEIIIMASIIEGEARTSKDRKIISGILWKRLDLGIALQVDASFVYINGKTTKELTKEDLKINSPYNTYLYRGLPPTPISNPGIESIKVAISPAITPYLYFLTDDTGITHYSRTFEEHVAKKQKYLSNKP